MSARITRRAAQLIEANMSTAVLGKVRTRKSAERTCSVRKIARIRAMF